MHIGYCHHCYVKMLRYEYMVGIYFFIEVYQRRCIRSVSLAEIHCTEYYNSCHSTFSRILRLSLSQDLVCSLGNQFVREVQTQFLSRLHVTLLHLARNGRREDGNVLKMKDGVIGPTTETIC